MMKKLFIVLTLIAGATSASSSYAVTNVNRFLDSFDRLLGRSPDTVNCRIVGNVDPFAVAFMTSSSSEKANIAEALANAKAIETIYK